MSEVGMILLFQLAEALPRQINTDSSQPRPCPLPRDLLGLRWLKPKAEVGGLPHLSNVRDEKVF